MRSGVPSRGAAFPFSARSSSSTRLSPPFSPEVFLRWYRACSFARLSADGVKHVNGSVMSTKPQVMVVDDDLAMCGFLQQFLATRGYGALTITSSDEAIKRFHAERPTAVLLDVIMPGMDG